MKKIVVMCLMMILLLATSTVSAGTLNGKIVQWENGTKKALAGATVIIGKNIWLDTSGIVDVVKGGKVTARTSTDVNGNFSLEAPNGSYIMILWKNHYVPSSGNITVPSYINDSISYDRYSPGKHADLRYENK